MFFYWSRLGFSRNASSSGCTLCSLTVHIDIFIFIWETCQSGDMLILPYGNGPPDLQG